MHARRNPAVPISARVILILVAIIIAAVVSAGATCTTDGIILATAVAAVAAEKPRYYTRNEAIDYLRGRGFPITKSTMPKLRALGQGPQAAARWSQT